MAPGNVPAGSRPPVASHPSMSSRHLLPGSMHQHVMAIGVAAVAQLAHVCPSLLRDGSRAQGPG
jgi:hypothetical protein